MARRLIDQNSARETRRQGALLDRFEVGFRNRIRAEIARAMGDMVTVYELTGDVPPARDHLAHSAGNLGPDAIAKANFQPIEQSPLPPRLSCAVLVN